MNFTIHVNKEIIESSLDVMFLKLMSTKKNHTATAGVSCSCLNSRTAVKEASLS